MQKKNFYLSMAVLMAIGTATAQLPADEDLIILDLTQSTTELTFNDVNGMWEGTYDDDETEIENQVFSIVHGSMEDWNTWWGFTASNSAENVYQANTLTYQFSNMALGGIVLNEDGTIKENEFGAPVTSKDVPYLVGFPMAGFPPSQIAFNTDKSYEVVGAYVNLNTYTFYSLIYGASPARAFTQNDDLKLIITGENEEGEETSVEVTLASYNNGNLTACTGWTYVDLSALGVVDELKFSMEGTDTGDWGLNTPSYFCIDKLAVKEAGSSAIESTEAFETKNTLRYDRSSKTIHLGKSEFAAVYDTMGHIVKTATGAESIYAGDLTAGVYVVKSGNTRLKFVR